MNNINRNENSPFFSRSPTPLPDFSSSVYPAFQAGSMNQRWLDEDVDFTRKISAKQVCQDFFFNEEEKGEGDWNDMPVPAAVAFDQHIDQANPVNDLNEDCVDEEDDDGSEDLPIPADIPLDQLDHSVTRSPDSTPETCYRYGRCTPFKDPTSLVRSAKHWFDRNKENCIPPSRAEPRQFLPDLSSGRGQKRQGSRLESPVPSKERKLVHNFAVKFKSISDQFQDSDEGCAIECKVSELAVDLF